MALARREKILLGVLGGTVVLYFWSRTKKGEALIQRGLDTLFLKPIEGRVTSPYGVRKDPISGKESGHNGIDFGVAVGTPIYAPFDGVVQVSNFVEPKYPSPNAVGMKKWLRADGTFDPSQFPAANGNYVIVTDATGKFTMGFAHMSRRDVKTGDKVKKGQILGLTGNTGYTTGPHAHVTLKVYGKIVDPMSVPEFAQMFA